MNLEQEKIAAALSKRSPGAPFLFVPHEYRAGKITVRACDLAWACSGCIILFRMTDCVRSREKMSRHNFNQLKSWYREWFAGRSLRGRNPYCAFDIPFDQYPHKVLLSVVKGGDAASELNPGVSEEFASAGLPRPTLCATISQNALAYLADQAGSALDLLGFVAELRDPLSEDLSLRAIRRRHNLSFNFAPASEFYAGSPKNPRLYTQDPIYTTLQCGGSSVTAHGENWDSFISSLLSDLSWSQIMQIVCHIRDLERKAGSLPPGVFGVRAAGRILDFPPYLFGLIVSKYSGSGEFERAGEQIGALQQAILNHGSYRERFSVLLPFNFSDPDRRTCSALVIPAPDETAPPLKSQITALLERIATAHSAYPGPSGG